MRATGDLTGLQGLGAHDHACWIHHGPEDLGRAFATFVREGLELGLRTEVVVRQTPAERDAMLAQIPGVGARLAAGDLRMSPPTETYGGAGPVDPEAQARHYRAATADACAAGHRGYRCAVDATDLVRDDVQRLAFRRWEHVADRLMAEIPWSAACAFDGDALPASACRELACLHPVARAGSTPFGLSAARGGRAIHGDVDFDAQELFAEALAVSHDHAHAGPLHFDLAEAEFLDHRSLWALQAYAADHDTAAVLHHTPASARRILELLPLDRIEVAS